MDNKNSNSHYESLCHRCSKKPIELICYECNPANSFCRNCDATTHSLPSKKNHKRDIVNFIFQNEQQKLQKEIMTMKQKKPASLDIITTPVKENFNNNNNNFNKKNNDNFLYSNNNKSNLVDDENNFGKKSFSSKTKTIEVLEQHERRKFIYENEYKNNDKDYNCFNSLGQNASQAARGVREHNNSNFFRSEFDSNRLNMRENYTNNNNYNSCQAELSKTMDVKKNGIESDYLLNENLNNNNMNFAKTMKTGSVSDIYHTSNSIYNNNINNIDNKAAAAARQYNSNNNHENYNTNEDKKITISCYDYPNNSTNNTNNEFSSNKNIKNKTNQNQYNNSKNNNLIENTNIIYNNNSYNNSYNNQNISSNLNANGNNAFTTLTSTSNNPKTNQNPNREYLSTKNLNAQTFTSTISTNSNVTAAAAELKTTNFITASSSSYYSKEFVNELTTLHSKEKEDMQFKMNLIQNSLENFKLSLSDHKQQIQKQLEESNLNYSSKIRNLEQQQRKLSEKNLWLNEQDKQKDKVIEGLKAQMKKLKESNAELLEKYEYHQDACKNDRVMQQKQFDELQTKLAQKEIEVEELKSFYNKKIEELVYLNANAGGDVNKNYNFVSNCNSNKRKSGAASGYYIVGLGGNCSNLNTMQQCESKQYFSPYEAIIHFFFFSIEKKRNYFYLFS